MTAKAKTTNRCDEVDGIRGWAAVIVLIHHVLYCSYSKYTAEYTSPFARLLNEVIGNGPVMVRIFFVLSGDALSYTITRRGSTGVSPGLILKRVLRLGGTVFIGAIFLYVALSIGWVRNIEAGNLLESHMLANDRVQLQRGPYTFLTFVYISFIGIFKGDQSMDCHLWTMRTELYCSFAVFAICAALHRLRFRVPLLLGALWFCHFYDRDIALFVFGIVLGELRSMDVFAWCHSRMYVRVIIGILALLTPLPRAFPSIVPEMLWPYLNYDATVLVFVFYASLDVVTFMRNRVSRFFGSISFALYVMHQHIQVTLFSYLVIKGGEHGWPVSVWFMAWTTMVDLIVTVLAAVVVHRIELRYISALDRVANYFIIKDVVVVGQLPCGYQEVSAEPIESIKEDFGLLHATSDASTVPPV